MYPNTQCPDSLTVKFSVFSVISWIFPEFHVNNTAVGEKAVAVQFSDCPDPEIHTSSISIAFSYSEQSKVRVL